MQVHGQRLVRILAFALAVAASAPSTRAQVEEIDPTYVVVTRPNENPALLRCFAGMVWYPVAELPQGRVLLADGKRDEFYRVGYPEDVPALVLTPNARIDESAGTLTLTNASELHARNLRQPTSIDSYKEILARPMPAGSQLALLGEMVEDGSTTGYFVRAPEAARAWVNIRHVRHATREEINGFLAAKQEEGQEAGQEEDQMSEPPHSPPPAPPAPPAPPIPSPTPQPLETSEPTTASQSTEEPNSSHAEGEPEEIDPTEEAAPEGSDSPPPPTSTDDEPTNDEPKATAPEPTLYERLADLDAAYDSIRSQDTAAAEITPLRAEYASLRDDARRQATEDEAYARMAQYAQAKVDLLELRAEVQLGKARLAALAERSDAAAQQLKQTRQDLIRARGYEMVGVLLRSSLYTGGSLPLRFRLQSSADETARTLAYLEIDEGTEVAPLLGSMVGVIPEADGVTRHGPVPIIRAALVERADQ